MSQQPQIIPLSFQVQLLEAYETRTPPPGSSGAYPVGHAVVRLRMENRLDIPVEIVVEDLKIASTGSSLSLMQQPVGAVQLGGLQIKESGFHLTNEQGFSQYSKVQAIVTYRYQGRVFTAASTALSVSVFP